MSYLGLNLDSLIWELGSLIKNNYSNFSKETLNFNFNQAKKDILNTFSDIINQNKEEVINDLKQELKE